MSGPQGIGLGVDANNFRNCMDVIPCQQDSPIMRDAEVASNNFGTCGRTQAGGNIDTSTAIEQHVDAKMVAEVTRGSTLTLQMHQGRHLCSVQQMPVHVLTSHSERRWRWTLQVRNRYYRDRGSFQRHQSLERCARFGRPLCHTTNSIRHETADAL